MWLNAPNFEVCCFICERTLLTMIFVDVTSSKNRLWRPGTIILLFWRMNLKFAFSFFYHQFLLIILQGTLGKISYTADASSAANLRPYFAITAHWAYRDDTDGSIKIKARLMLKHGRTELRSWIGRQNNDGMANGIETGTDRCNYAG